MKNKYQITVATASSISERIEACAEDFLLWNIPPFSTLDQQYHVRLLIKTYINICFSLMDDTKQELLIFNEDHKSNIRTLMRKSITGDILLILEGEAQTIDNASKLGYNLSDKIIETLSDIQASADDLISSVQEEEEK